MIPQDEKEKRIKILQDELTLHKKMLLLLKTEKGFIINQKIKELAQVTQKKESLIRQMRKKESRQDINFHLETGPSFLKIKQEFKEILDKIKQAQEVNSYLIRENLEFTQKFINILSSPAEQPQYNLRGNIKDNLSQCQYLEILS